MFKHALEGAQIRSALGSRQIAILPEVITLTRYLFWVFIPQSFIAYLFGKKDLFEDSP